MPHELHLLLICSNSGSCIYRTLTSWSGAVDSVNVLVNNTNDNTLSELEKYIQDNPEVEVNVTKSFFTNFADTRNRLIEKTREVHLKKGYYISIDDSYELRGPKDSLRKELNESASECLLMTIRKGSFAYQRTAVYREWCQYTGEIHEGIRERPTGSIRSVHLEDIQYPGHITRTESRRDNDLILLRRQGTPRSRYYIAAHALRSTQGESLEKYIITHKEDPEAYSHVYMSYMMLASYYPTTNLQIRNLLLAVKYSERIHKSLAIDPLFRLYQVTKCETFLNLAEKRRLEGSGEPPDVSVIVNTSLYKKGGLVAICSLRLTLLKELMVRKGLEKDLKIF